MRRLAEKVRRRIVVRVVGNVVGEVKSSRPTPLSLMRETDGRQSRLRDRDARFADSDVKADLSARSTSG